MFTFSFFSCGTTPLPQPEPVQEARMESDGDVVSVSVPVQKKKTFFSDVKKTDLDAVEIGSPQSLRIAYNSLHRSVDDEYSDTERSLVKVICAIMNLVWPSENGSYIAPEIRVPDQYSGAVDSARRGIYDLSTDSSDFLSLVLPSIALVTSSNVSEYYGRAEESLQKALCLRSDSVIANYLMGARLYVRPNRLKLRKNRQKQRSPQVFYPCKWKIFFRNEGDSFWNCPFLFCRRKYGHGSFHL